MKEHNSPRHLYVVPKTPPVPKNRIFARLLRVLASWSAFFARPATAAQKAPKAQKVRSSPARTSVTPKKSSGSRLAARKHLRVVHTGTRI